MQANESQLLNKFLEEQEKQDQELLFGVFKDRQSDNVVKLLLWIVTTSDFSDFVIEVPEEVIVNVEPTLESAYHKGKRLIISRVNFDNEKLKTFMSPEEVFKQLRRNQITFEVSKDCVDLLDERAIRGQNAKLSQGGQGHTQRRILTGPII